jgi:hypothetical protein
MAHNQRQKSPLRILKDCLSGPSIQDGLMMPAGKFAGAITRRSIARKESGNQGCYAGATNSLKRGLPTGSRADSNGCPHFGFAGRKIKSRSLNEERLIGRMRYPAMK